jgi:hypothetical protein
VPAHYARREPGVLDIFSEYSLKIPRIYSIFPCWAGVEVLRARRASAQTTLDTTQYIFFYRTQNFYEAVQDPRWIAAVQKEVDSILENSTWELVQNIPHGKEPINAMWIFKAKTGPSGKIEKLKVRIVAKENE